MAAPLAVVAAAAALGGAACSGGAAGADEGPAALTDAAGMNGPAGHVGGVRDGGSAGAGNGGAPDVAIELRRDGAANAGSSNGDAGGVVPDTRGIPDVRIVGADAGGSADAGVPAEVGAPPSACPAGSTVITGGSLQTAVAATPVGGTLCLDGGSYTVSSGISLARSITILGVGLPQIRQTFTGYIFAVSAGNVTIQGLKMIGANRDGTGDSCSGTGAIRVGGVRNVSLLDNLADTFTCGFSFGGTDGFVVKRNELRNIKYAAISTFPAFNGTIDHNKVIDLNVDGPLGQNAYGIVASGNRSKQIVISNNLVQNAPTWECFDTHDGEAIHFLDNTCIRPGRVGINVVHVVTAAPLDCRIEGNTIDAGGLKTQWDAVVHTGTGTVKNNTSIGFACSDKWTFYVPQAEKSGNVCK